MSHDAKRIKRMIIELFGPSGAGKTTLTYALSDALQRSGHRVQLVVSSRPAERPAGDDVVTSARARISRAMAPVSRAAKILSAMPLLQNAQGDDTGSRLMALLPPRNVVWAIRYRRYLAQLCRSWAEARSSGAVVIFDQAYLTALCSLVILARPAGRTTLAQGLNLLPKPDLLVRLDAPRELLESRLRERLDRQGRFERLFEFDLKTNLRQIDVADDVTAMLHEQGRSMVHISSLDIESLQSAVRTITGETAMTAGALPA